MKTIVNVETKIICNFAVVDEQGNCELLQPITVMVPKLQEELFTQACKMLQLKKNELAQ